MQEWVVCVKEDNKFEEHNPLFFCRNEINIVYVVVCADEVLKLPRI